MSTMTYEQATEQAVRLHNQGLTYPKIEEHLKSAGYISARTKKPVGHLAVRHMVTQVTKGDDKQASKKKGASAAGEEKIVLRSPARDTLDAIQKILAIPDIDTEVKMVVVQALSATKGV